jgi:hypothetical protein
MSQTLWLRVRNRADGMTNPSLAFASVLKRLLEIDAAKPTLVSLEVVEGGTAAASRGHPAIRFYGRFDPPLHPDEIWNELSDRVVLDRWDENCGGLAAFEFEETVRWSSTGRDVISSPLGVSVHVYPKSMQRQRNRQLWEEAPYDFSLGFDAWVSNPLDNLRGDDHERARTTRLIVTQAILSFCAEKLTDTLVVASVGAVPIPLNYVACFHRNETGFVRDMESMSEMCNTCPVQCPDQLAQGIMSPKSSGVEASDILKLCENERDHELADYRRGVRSVGIARSCKQWPGDASADSYQQARRVRDLPKNREDVCAPKVPEGLLVIGKPELRGTLCRFYADLWSLRGP